MADNTKAVLALTQADVDRRGRRAGAVRDAGTENVATGPGCDAAGDGCRRSPAARTSPGFSMTTVPNTAGVGVQVLVAGSDLYGLAGVISAMIFSLKLFKVGP